MQNMNFLRRWSFIVSNFLFDWAVLLQLKIRILSGWVKSSLLFYRPFTYTIYLSANTACQILAKAYRICFALLKHNKQAMQGCLQSDSTCTVSRLKGPAWRIIWLSKIQSLRNFFAAWVGLFLFGSVAGPFLMQVIRLVFEVPLGWGRPHRERIKLLLRPKETVQRVYLRYTASEARPQNAKTGQKQYIPSLPSLAIFF